jgi:hypothetical protein
MPPKFKRTVSARPSVKPKKVGSNIRRSLAERPSVRQSRHYRPPINKKSFITPETIEREADRRAQDYWGVENFKAVLGTTSSEEMLRVQKALSKLPIPTWNKDNRTLESKYLWSHILTAQQKAKLRLEAYKYLSKVPSVLSCMRKK